MNLLSVLVLALMASNLFGVMPEGGFADRCSELIGNRGAVAVMDIQTGILLAATDPDILFRKRFPPGSVAKILTGLAAIEKGIECQDSFLCEGVEVINGDTFHCSLKPGHGAVDFDKALTVSCNLYFQNLARNLSGKDLVEIYRTLKLNRRVGIDLPGEEIGLIQEPITDSARLQFAIGQGSAIQLTPVAVLSLISGIAAEGQLIRPHLSPGQAEVLSSFPCQQALADILPILRNVVKRGTAQAANISTVAVAGKTGSATVLGNWVTHGWFAGFAPYEAPRIAIVVFLNRGEGKDAAHLAGLMISEYFREYAHGN